MYKFEKNHIGTLQWKKKEFDISSTFRKSCILILLFNYLERNF